MCRYLLKANLQKGATGADIFCRRTLTRELSASWHVMMSQVQAMIAAAADFFWQEDLYSGVWYELAYHDVTQANYFCGCTRFNFTKRSATFIEDMFTTTCPMTGILPGTDFLRNKRETNESLFVSLLKSWQLHCFQGCQSLPEISLLTVLIPVIDTHRKVCVLGLGLCVVNVILYIGLILSSFQPQNLYQGRIALK